MINPGLGPETGPETGPKTGPETDPGIRRDRDSPTTQTVFLERLGYRRRRLLDIARLLPLFGVLLLLIPLMWPGSDAVAVADGLVEPMPMSGAITYIFTVWAVLIGASMLFGLAARFWGGDDRPIEPGRG